MLRYTKHLLLVAALTQSKEIDTSQNLLYNQCPCLWSRTCPKTSRCYIDHQIDKISERLQSPSVFRRHHLCPGGCHQPVSVPIRRNGEPSGPMSTSTQSAANLDIPISLTRSQRRHIRRVASASQLPAGCGGSACSQALVSEGTQHADATPAFILRQSNSDTEKNKSTSENDYTIPSTSHPPRG